MMANRKVHINSKYLPERDLIPNGSVGNVTYGSEYFKIVVWLGGCTMLKYAVVLFWL